MNAGQVLGVILFALTACAAKKPAGTVLGVLNPSVHVDGPIGSWAPDPNEPRLAPIGRWIRAGDEVGFTYVDSDKGLSVRWDGGAAVEIRRLQWAPAGVRVLTPDEVAVAGLAPVPEWLSQYGPQDSAGTLYGAWRVEAGISHRFHPEYPDDLRVLIGQVGEGTVRSYEVIWIGVRSCVALRCEGVLLNQPGHSPLDLGQRVWFDAGPVQRNRLPAATAIGSPIPPLLVAFANTSELVADMIRDADAWVPDYDLPAEERMLVVGRWGVVDGQIVYLFLGPTAVNALKVSTTEPVVTEALLWMPRGLEFLSEEHRPSSACPRSWRSLARLHSRRPASGAHGGSPPRPGGCSRRTGQTSPQWPFEMRKGR